MGKIAGTFCITLAILALLGLIGFWVSCAVVSYQYERDIGSYMSTAVDTITPESFKEQLLLSKQAMLDAGLTENDYGAMWFKKPDNSMKFQFQHIDSIIGRTDAMIQWKNSVYSNQSAISTNMISGEALRDVYSDKMNQLRAYINEDYVRSDWIAKDAWYVKYHPAYYFAFGISILWILAIIALFIFGGIAFSSYNPYREVLNSVREVESW